jgi:hypothetical protein
MDVNKILDEIKKLRENKEYEKIIDLTLSVNRYDIPTESKIKLLDEILIAAWYTDKRELAINCGYEMYNLSYSEGIKLQPRQITNMKFVLPKMKVIKLRELRVFISGKVSEKKDEYVYKLLGQGFKDPIFMHNLDSNIINITPPYIFIFGKLAQVPEEVEIDTFTEYKEFDNFVLVLKKESYIPKIENGIKSWDVFDTLIGRKCYYPIEIFNQVALLSATPNFSNIRIRCEKDTLSTYDDIYKEMEKYAVNTEQLKKLEFETELSNVFPIIENINKVQDLDILVSDTYLSEDQIWQLLHKIGFTKNVKVYTSYGGKSKGYIWNEIKKSHAIVMHTGDNYNSDVKIPKQFGIPTQHYNSTYNQIESLILESQPSLAAYSRMIRLMNPHSDILGKLWNYQVNYNIPLLLMACKYLDEYCQQNGYRKILFCTRDSSVLIKLFTFAYPKYESIYFHSSRIANIKASSDYKNYIKSLLTDQTVTDQTVADQTVVVDLCGTGFSGNVLYEELNFPKRFYLLNLFRNLDKKYNIDFIISSKSYNNSYLEILNYDTIGCLEDVEFKDGKYIDIRQPVKYDISLLDYIPQLLELIFTQGLPEIKMDEIQNTFHKLLSHLNTTGQFLNTQFNHNIKE